MGYKNGFFQLEVKDGRTYIKLFPPRNGGTPINIKELAGYLESENIFDFDINKLNQAIEGLNEDVVLVPVAQNEILPTDEKMMFQVSEDRLRVVARFYPASKGVSYIKGSIVKVIRLLKEPHVDMVRMLGLNIILM